jgi:ABC-type Fe3+-hydroxamate transport system substrate-binding protein
VFKVSDGKQDTVANLHEESTLFVCKNVDYYRPFDRVGGQAQVLAHHTLIAVCSGTGRLGLGLHKLDISSGWFVLLPPGTYVELEDQSASYEHKLEWFVLSFDLVKIDDGGHREHVRLPESAFYSEAADWNKAITDLLLQWPQRHAGMAEALRFQGMFNLRMADVLTRIQESSANDINLGQQGSVLEQVLAYIHQHYDKKISRKDAIELSGLPTRTFTLRFKQRQGITFNEYLNRIRIHKAIEWLLLSDAPLSEIASKVGYADEFYLSRKFKQIIGVSPSAFVKKTKTYAAMEDAYTVDLLTLGVVPRTAVMNDWVGRHFDRALEAGGCRQMRWGMLKEERLDVLRAIKPDLIIAPMMGVIERDQLSAIAPLIEMPWQGVGWKQHFERVAALVGRKAQARAWLSAFEIKLGEVKSALAERMDDEATVAIMNVRSNSLRIYASTYMGGDLLYDSLRFNPPPLVEDMRRKGIDNLYMNDEQMFFLDADYIFLTVEDHAVAKARLEKLKAAPRWHDIRAVQRKRVFEVDMAKWYGYAPAALEAQLADVMKYMLGE